MMMLSEIAKALNATLRGPDVNVLSVGTDSRNIVKGQLFVAIKGEHFDGNAFAVAAIEKGAAAAMLSNANIHAAPGRAIPSIVVKDTRLALGELAHYWRNQFELPLVAVTGSNGKTTVKEMITAILNSARGKVLATRGNLNNDIGLPLTLLGMNKNHTYAVIEMGMNHEGEISYLTHIARPNVALINNAGTAHIGQLGSTEAIARAKGEIFAGLTEDGIAVINEDDRFADYWKSLNQHRQVITFGLSDKADVSATYTTQNNRSEIQLKTPSGSVAFSLGMLGEHNVHNALAASAAAVALGISNADIAAGLSGFNPVKGRLNWLQGVNDAAVIDDTYNANPDSMKAAIDVLSKLNTRKIFVMGDMGELGENAPQMHADIGAYAKQKGIDYLFSLGELSQLASQQFGANFGTGAQHFNALEALLEVLHSHMKSDVTVLVKGSRFMKMERVVNQILKEKTIEGAH